MAQEIKDIAQALRDIQRDMPDLIREVMDENKTLIEDLIIDQLDEGKDGNDEYLPDYSPGSVQFFGKTPGPMTLEHTGAWRRGIKVETFEDRIETGSTDSKDAMLRASFGDAITKISEPNVERLINEILHPELMRKIYKRLGYEQQF